jgi:RNA polymerase sigma-70 factor, ECF subfamily
VPALAVHRPASPAGPKIEALFAEHVRFVWRILAAHGIRSADVEDLTQEVFLVAHRRIEEGDEGRSPRSWLYAIAIRIAANHRRLAHVRRERPEEVVAAPAATIDPDESIDRERLRERLYAALETLEEDKRHVLVLYELEGLPMKEVAQMLGCPLSTLYTRLYAAREDLGRALRISMGVRR